MSLTAGAVIFLVLVVVLSALRRRLVFELSGVSLLLFGTPRPGVVVYSILVLPGTIVHELSHWVVAEVLQVRTGEIVIFPETSDGKEDQRLGSVATEQTDPVRGFLIGIAPFFTGLGLLLFIGYLLNQTWVTGGPWWQILLMGYGIMVLGNSMMISKADRRSWPIMFVLIMAVVAALWKTNIVLPPSLLSTFAGLTTQINIVLGMTLGLNLGMIAVSYFVRYAVERLIHKKVIQKRR